MSAKKAARRRRAGPRGKAPTPVRPRRAFRIAIAFAAGLVLGTLGPWIAWLDHYAAERFVERQWKQAGRVYARPLELFPGRVLAPAEFELELTAAGLYNAGALQPGRWKRDGTRFTVALPALQFADDNQAAQTVEVRFDGRGVNALRTTDGTSLAQIRLPPAELGTLLPLDQRDRTVLPIEQFPTLLVAGIQAVEDRQFARHHGIDPKAIFRALISNLRSGDIVQGGSTITQQLVKNLFLSSEQTLLRKLNEAIMSVSLELRFSKAQILEAYLNDVYLGQRGPRAIHGFGRAAEFYFGVPIGSLSSDQIALLIGMVRGASWYHPVRNPERALARRNLVLDLFLETGLIDAREHQRARARPLGVADRQRSTTRSHPAFMDLVQRQLRADYRESDLREQGLKIYTTLSPLAQRQAERALDQGLDALDPGGELQGAIVLARPDSGEIRAVVGDRQVHRPGFNRALDARRQVGSVIKPFVYLLALADPARFTLVTPLDDAPIRVPQRGRPDWQPDNYDRISHGRVPLLDALVHSYNQATVALGLEVGVDALFRLLGQLGVVPGDARHPAAFLGAIDLTPLQVTQLYQALASGGYSTPLRAITDVVDADGNSVARYPMRLRPIEEHGALALIDHALGQVVDRGTAESLRWRLTAPEARKAPVRGKTGTTSDKRDAWFAGYTGQWLGVVWVGRDDNRPADVGGAASALPIWARLFDALPQDPPPRRWPDTIEWFWIDWPNPELAEKTCPGARAVPFIAGSQPETYSGCVRF